MQQGDESRCRNFMVGAYGNTVHFKVNHGLIYNWLQILMYMHLFYQEIKSYLSVEIW